MVFGLRVAGRHTSHRGTGTLARRQDLEPHRRILNELALSHTPALSAHSHLSIDHRQHFR
jgi:hypothetical protein